MTGKFVLTIELGNAEMCSRGAVARKLKEVAKDVVNFQFDSMKISDINGNGVGRWEFVKEPKTPYRGG